MEGKSLYERLGEAGCEMDSWQSDLYVKSTPEARAIISEFEAEGRVSNAESFVSEKDGKRWIDLPFAFDPWWESRKRKTPGESSGGSAPKP